MTRTPKILPIRQSASTGYSLPTVDVFFEVFNLARTRGRFVEEATLPAGESLAFAEGDGALHIVQDAPCSLIVPRQLLTLELAPGDIIMLPRGPAHRFENRTAQPARLATGAFAFEGLHADILLQGLPERLCVRSADGAPGTAGIASAWVPMTIAALEQELRHPSVGSAVMLSRIFDLLFIWAIRHWLAGDGAGHRGWIAALRDPVIGLALAQLHANPAHAWTVDALAAGARQSRSNFTGRFTALVGEPPMRYLTRWRMQLASQLLRESSLRVSQIAERVGYESQAAFSRVFRRTFGVAPSDYQPRE